MCGVAPRSARNNPSAASADPLDGRERLAHLIMYSSEADSFANGDDEYRYG